MRFDLRDRLAIESVTHEFESPTFADSAKIEDCLDTLTNALPIILLDCGAHFLLEFASFCGKLIALFKSHGEQRLNH